MPLTKPATACLLALSLAFAAASPRAASAADIRAHLPVTGPQRTELPIVRPTPSYPRIFVQAELPDGELGLFLIDTGADISVLSQSTADRLGLAIQEGYSTLQGLSGSTRMDRSVIPTIAFGEGGDQQVVHNIEVAVGVRGVSDSVQFLPLDGILGNNVWSRFVVEIDYPKNKLVLHAPDTVKRTRPRKDSVDLWDVDAAAGLAPMRYDGQHIFSPITLTTDGDPGHTDTILTQVDTGAGELTLCAGTGALFEEDYTEGLETIRGIGASENLPPHRFLEMTRRIPLERVVLGGARFDVHSSARWMLYDRTDINHCGTGMRALLGHDYLYRHRVFFDYGNQRMAMVKSRGKPVPVNGHAVFLEQDIAKHGADRPDRALYRAKLHIGAGNDDEAVAMLTHLPTDLPPAEAGEARVLLARIQRHRGDLEGAWAALADTPVEQLVEQGEIISAVNGLLFEERGAEALALAQAAVEAVPDSGDARVARADVHQFEGNTDAATADLQEAARLDEYPDAHLLRRARIALTRDDRYGSMAHVRKLLRLYPYRGEFLWFYAMLVQGEQDADTFRSDMQGAMARLHPGMQPIDFQVAAHHTIGEDDLAAELMQRGVDDMCSALPESSTDYDNCLAWFYALAGVRPDDALRRIERAIDQTGERSDYLDTKAMVHLSRGELELATESAWAAARLSPDDVYMLWQAERIRDLRDQARKASAP